MSEPLNYQPALPIQSGKLAMLIFLSTEIMFFTALIATYIVLRFSEGGSWPDQSEVHLQLWIGIANTVILISSSFTIYFATVAAASDRAASAKIWLVATLLFGTVFLAFKGFEYYSKFQHGIHPTSMGTLIHEEADEVYLSRTVSELRSAINDLEKNVASADHNGVGDEKLRQLYKVQAGIVDWTQYKVGLTGDRLMRKRAIESLAHQIYPVSNGSDLQVEKYLNDELEEVRIDHRHEREKLEQAEALLKLSQEKIKKLLPQRESGDSEIKERFANESSVAEILTNQISAIHKRLNPLVARIEASEQFQLDVGLNDRFDLKLPIVVPGGKTWVNTYFLLTGFHAIHLFVGLIVLAGWILLRFGKNRVHWLENFSLYWHLVDIVWLVIFVVVYLS